MKRESKPYSGKTQHHNLTKDTHFLGCFSPVLFSGDLNTHM